MWKNIATAPKDETAFLAYCPKRNGYVARQDYQIIHWSGWRGGIWENVSGHKINLWDVTHWMPLPERPDTGQFK